MNDYNNLHRLDELGDWFQELPQEEVSNSFTRNVLEKVEKFQHRKKHKAQFIAILAPILGIVGIILAVSVIFYSLEIQLPAINIDFQSIASQIVLFLKENILFFMIGFITLFLLIGDFFLRNRNIHKELHSNS